TQPGQSARPPRTYPAFFRLRGAGGQPAGPVGVWLAPRPSAGRSRRTPEVSERPPYRDDRTPERSGALAPEHEGGPSGGQQMPGGTGRTRRRERRGLEQHAVHAVADLAEGAPC